ncbi:MAG: hypothetical protein COC05_02475 [Gammaproteobacteria bacterium]|nr:MAG: hypothetical protein COC05_02475 [Gammaproteobacteria bacterium]
MEKCRSGFSGRRAMEEGMPECNERRVSDVIRSRVGRRAVGAKGMSCRVGEAIFGKDAIKSIPR